MSVNIGESTNQEILERLRSPFKGIDVKYLRPFGRAFVQTNRIHSFGGDVLIQRVRGLSGQRNKLYQSATDLHLRKIGQGCIIDANDLCALGKAKKLQHLLRITPLPSYVPPGKFRLAYWSTGMTLVHESYQNSNASGESVVVGDAEYLKVESTPENASVTWSSDLGIEEALAKIHDAAGAPLAEATGYISLSENGESSAGEGRVSDIVHYVENHAEHIKFAFVPHENFDFVWAGRQARLVSSEVPYTQIGIISKRKIGGDVLNRILAETASPCVSTESTKVIASMKSEAAPMPRLQADGT